MLILAAACYRSGTFVCTGQRLMRASVVLWSTPGLASMKRFAIFSSDIVAAYFSSRLFSFLTYFILQPEPTRDLYGTKKNDSTSDAYV